MNWTTFDPIEGQKYIVETNNGSVFPAHVINGNSWWSDKGFPIEGVTRWIPYPTGGGGENDDIPIEVLFKYVCRDFKNMKRIAQEESEKVSQMKKLNREVVSECNRLIEENKELKLELAMKDNERSEEMDNLYRMVNELTKERDELKARLEERTQVESHSEPSKDLLRENKQMKAFLRSIMNTCDTVRELEIA